MAEGIFDFIEAQNAADLSNIERAVLEGDAVGSVQSGRNDFNGVGFSVPSSPRGSDTCELAISS